MRKYEPLTQGRFSEKRIGGGFEKIENVRQGNKKRSESESQPVFEMINVIFIPGYQERRTYGVQNNHRHPVERIHVN